MSSPYTTASISSSPIEKYFSASFRYWLANVIGRIVSSICFCHKVISKPVRRASVDLILSRLLAKCSKHGVSVVFLYRWNSLALFRSSSILIFFQSVCLLQSVLAESLDTNFAIYCIATRSGFISLHDVHDSKCKIAFIISFFGFFPRSVISSPSQRVSLREVSDFFSLALYPASWSCLSILNYFSRFLSLSPLVATIISCSQTGAPELNVLSIFLWQFVGIYGKPWNPFLESIKLIPISSGYRKVAVFACFFG